MNEFIYSVYINTGIGCNLVKYGTEKAEMVVATMLVSSKDSKILEHLYSRELATL